jgi:hypothetical protein
MSERFWMIANTTDEKFESGWRKSRLPDRCRPQFLYYHRADAETELLRLQAAYPKAWFYLLEAVAYCEPSAVAKETIYFITETETK